MSCEHHLFPPVVRAIDPGSQSKPWGKGQPGTRQTRQSCRGRRGAVEGREEGQREEGRERRREGRREGGREGRRKGRQEGEEGGKERGKNE